MNKAKNNPLSRKAVEFIPANFDHLIYGAVLVLFTISTVLGMISVGTVPNCSAVP